MSHYNLLTRYFGNNSVSDTNARRNNDSLSISSIPLKDPKKGIVTNTKYGKNSAIHPHGVKHIVFSVLFSCSPPNTSALTGNLFYLPVRDEM